LKNNLERNNILHPQPCRLHMQGKAKSCSLYSWHIVKPVKWVLVEFACLDIKISNWNSWKREDQQNVITTASPRRRGMVIGVLLVYCDPHWSTFSVKFEKVWIRVDQSGQRSAISLMKSQVKFTVTGVPVWNL